MQVDMMTPMISIIIVEGGALTAGLYNNLFYYITEEGEVRVKFVSFSNWDKTNADKLDKIFPWGNHFETIASLKSFPLDSIASDNILAVATVDGLKLLPIKGKYVGDDVISFPNLRPISINRFGEFIAFSLEKDGLFFVNKLNNATKQVHLKVESDRIVSSSGYALNLYSESVPKLLKPKDIGDPNYDDSEENYLSRELVIGGSLEDALIKNEVIGRDVSIAYTDGKSIIIEDEYCNLYAIGLGKGKINREQIYSKNRAFFDTYTSRQAKVNLITSKEHWIQDNNKKRELLPIMLHYHPLGLIEQYMNHVDFIDATGKRTILIENEDVAEVRTHIGSHAYRTMVTIAAENHVVIAKISCSKR